MTVTVAVAVPVVFSSSFPSPVFAQRFLLPVLLWWPVLVCWRTLPYNTVLSLLHAAKGLWTCCWWSLVLGGKVPPEVASCRYVACSVFNDALPVCH